MSFVRSSKVRHVFGQVGKEEDCYEGFAATKCSSDEGTFIAANGKYVAFCVEDGGTGVFSVLLHAQGGQVDKNLPKIRAHEKYILDLKWNPYNDDVIASCSEDGTICIWEIPQAGLSADLDQQNALFKFKYHEDRCVQLEWHPIASNVLLSVSHDLKVIVWNVAEGFALVEITFPDIIWNACWSSKGDKIVTSCKDKNFRVHDARTSDLLKEVKAPNGWATNKPQCVIFTQGDKCLLSTGSSRMGGRYYFLFNLDTMMELACEEVDSKVGTLNMYYDPSVQMVYIASSGDSGIAYYEIDDKAPYVHYLNSFNGAHIQRGLAYIPKRDVSVNKMELFRFFKLHTTGNDKGVIQPISFILPRKDKEVFQSDVYPDAVSPIAALTAEEWSEGRNAEPNRIDMSTKFGKVEEKEHLPPKDRGNVEEKEESPPKDPSSIEYLQWENKALKKKIKKYEEEISSLVEKNKKYEKQLRELMEAFTL